MPLLFKIKRKLSDFIYLIPNSFELNNHVSSFNGYKYCHHSSVKNLSKVNVLFIVIWEFGVKSILPNVSNWVVVLFVLFGGLLGGLLYVFSS